MGSFLAIVSCIAMGRVGFLGGQIRHTELRESIPIIEQVYELHGDESDSTGVTKEDK
ncbi:MAG: hypothetical protein IPM69_09345 [Ignavibacteria bacterium]|nr:hypothetical protein [Ignavibacteria bacterium]